MHLAAGLKALRGEISEQFTPKHELFRALFPKRVIGPAVVDGQMMYRANRTTVTGALCAQRVERLEL